MPDGNSDTETSPRSTGSSPVTAWISLATASRTDAGGNEKDSAISVTNDRRDHGGNGNREAF